MKLVRALLPALVMVSANALPAAEPAALQRVFPHQAEVVASGPGLSRLELPAEVLARCRADLSDLRLFDDRDREVPYLVLAATENTTVVEILQRAAPVVRDATRLTHRSTTSPDRFEEQFTLEVPPVPPNAGRWELVLDVAAAEFVARLDLTADTAEGDARILVDGGSAFRLRQPEAEQVRFALPPETNTLDIGLVSEAQGFLHPRFRLEAVRQTTATGASEVPLTILERIAAADHTEIVVERPRALVATTLLLGTSTGALRRQVTVWDEGPGAASEPVGSAVVFRVDALAPVEALAVPLAGPRGDRLRLVVDDGDSPPLADLTVAAVVPQPVLFFSLPDGARSGMLRFGGARAHRPRYDLAALAPVLGGGTIAGEAADRALPFLDPGRSREATLGPVMPNPGWDPQPALAFAMNPGAPLDPAPFSHRRRLGVTPSEEGLARLRLGPEDLALLRPDLADVRVVDDDRRQWAYLLEPDADTAVVAAEVLSQRVKDGRSRYELRPPFTPMAVERLELRIDAPFFDRGFRLLGASEERREIQLASGRLVRHHGDPRPPIVSLPETRVVGLSLEIEDGDDAPLAITEVGLATPVADLYLVAPTGELTLLLGDPEQAAPRYELARVRSTVLAVPSLAVLAGALEPNPAFSAAARLGRGQGPQRLLLWVALGIAVAALGLITLRLARQSAD